MGKYRSTNSTGHKYFYKTIAFEVTLNLGSEFKTKVKNTGIGTGNYKNIGTENLQKPLFDFLRNPTRYQYLLVKNFPVLSGPIL